MGLYSKLSDVKLDLTEEQIHVIMQIFDEEKNNIINELEKAVIEWAQKM
jgi:hypothetical protein